MRRMWHRDFSKQEDAALQQVKEEIKAVGFELTPLGNESYSLNAIPTGIDGTDYAKLLHNLLWTASENKNAVKQTMAENIALAMAQTAAIAYGQTLNNDEMRHLVERLFSISNPNRTPDGKIVFNLIDDNKIEHLF